MKHKATADGSTGFQNIAQGYKETLPERRLRLFWESQTFETTERILDAIIFQNQTPDPLMVRVRAEPRQFSSDLASMLFEPRKDIRVVATNEMEPSLRQTKKKNFLLDIAYRGSDFCGWQTQPNNRLLPSVQQSLEEWLQPLCPNAPVDVRASGRTDAGVHSLGQVCRFRTHKDASAAQVLEHLEACPLAKQGSLRCLKVTQVSDSFHPTFGCKKRAYAYIMDSKDITENQVECLNAMLQRLEGLELDYFGFSYGKKKTETTLCTLEVARASFAKHSSEKVICVELIGDRFLRRMVRILVATALRQVMDTACHNSNDGLLDIIQSRDRKSSAKAAPPAGLIFVGAAFRTYS
jgi:tRNA pseudouridine(38-40) synthase